jgi:uncharacterized membrane protein
MDRKRIVGLALGALGIALIALGAVFLLAPDAVAQSTGGSFGGGSFGGGGGGGGGGFSGGGGGGYSGGGFGGGSYGGSYGGGGCDGSPMSILCTLAMFAVFFIVIPIMRSKLGGVGRPSDHLYTGGPSGGYAPQWMDVSAVMIAIDARARRFVQERLEQLASEGDTSTPGGLAHLLHETITVLRRAERAWVYAGAYNTSPDHAGATEQKFRQVAQTMRERYRYERVRAHDGQVRTVDAPAQTARREEGEGLVIVTVLVAARGEIPDVSQTNDIQRLDQLMRALGAVTAQRMVALEVIWSPAEENDRMSSAELERLYPEMRKIDGVDRMGRHVCQFCAFPYALELAQCPNCGAPAPTDDAGPAAPGVMGPPT